jgi:hypothetical protein
MTCPCVRMVRSERSGGGTWDQAVTNRRWEMQAWKPPNLAKGEWRKNRTSFLQYPRYPRKIQACATQQDRGMDINPNQVRHASGVLEKATCERRAVLREVRTSWVERRHARDGKGGKPTGNHPPPIFYQFPGNLLMTGHQELINSGQRSHRQRAGGAHRYRPRRSKRPTPVSLVRTTITIASSALGILGRREVAYVDRPGAGRASPWNDN